MERGNGQRTERAKEGEAGSEVAMLEGEGCVDAMRAKERLEQGHWLGLGLALCVLGRFWWGRAELIPRTVCLQGGA
jgi:hypothetical protein